MLVMQRDACRLTGFPLTWKVGELSGKAIMSGNTGEVGVIFLVSGKLDICQLHCARNAVNMFPGLECGVNTDE